MDAYVTRKDSTRRRLPRVVRLRRQGGKVVQSCDVYIGRAWSLGGWQLEESKWANPFTERECGTKAKAVEAYRNYLATSPALLTDLKELEGKVLGCWYCLNRHAASCNMC
jgi:hypothetical protein